jgi:hypothetical protein
MDKYINFPISILRKGLIDKKIEVFDDIITAGRGKYAENVEVDQCELIALLIKAYFYQNDSVLFRLPPELKSKLNKMELQPNEAQYQIGNALKTDKRFEKISSEYFRFFTAATVLGIYGDPEINIRKYKDIKINLKEREPFAGISKNKIFEFRDSEKTEFELVVFAAYLGIRSILGQKEFVRTNREMIKARMLGFCNHAMLKENENEIPFHILKYTKRYHYERILEELELNWHLKIITQLRKGTFVGKGEMTYEELFSIAERSLKYEKREGLKELKAAALKTYKNQQHKNNTKTTQSTTQKTVITATE